jgi:hypothetical protein
MMRKNLTLVTVPHSFTLILKLETLFFSHQIQIPPSHDSYFIAKILSYTTKYTNKEKKTSYNTSTTS